MRRGVDDGVDERRGLVDATEVEERFRLLQAGADGIRLLLERAIEGEHGLLELAPGTEHATAEVPGVIGVPVSRYQRGGRRGGLVHLARVEQRLGLEEHRPERPRTDLRGSGERRLRLGVAVGLVEDAAQHHPRFVELGVELDRAPGRGFTAHEVRGGEAPLGETERAPARGRRARRARFEEGEAGRDVAGLDPAATRLPFEVGGRGSAPDELAEEVVRDVAAPGVGEEEPAVAHLDRRVGAERARRRGRRSGDDASCGGAVADGDHGGDFEARGPGARREPGRAIRAFGGREPRRRVPQRVAMDARGRYRCGRRREVLEDLREPGATCGGALRLRGVPRSDPSAEGPGTGQSGEQGG